MAHSTSSSKEADRLKPAAIAALLADHVEEVAETLLPKGVRKGNEWMVGGVEGHEGKSLKIRLTGERAGLWSDFATGDDKGDLLGLWAVVKDIPLADAMREARDYLGVEQPKFAGHKRKTYADPGYPDDLQALGSATGVVDFLIERGLGDSIKAYKLAAVGDDQVVFPYMRDGKVFHYKFRSIYEKRFASSEDTEPGLFGWQAIGQNDRQIIITEGEFDALAWYEYGHPALSIPFGGSGNQDWIENEFDNLERFDIIYLSMDMDQTGEQAISTIIERLGRWRCKVIDLPHKDANECLCQDVAKEDMQKCLGEARELDPEELRAASEYTDEIIGQFYPQDTFDPGWDLPWESAFLKFRFRAGEVTLISGYNGHGKSTGVGHIVAETLKVGVRRCVASLEMKPPKWLANLTRQVTCEAEPIISLIRQVSDWWCDKLWVFNVVGTTKVDRLLSTFEYAFHKYGVKFFVIDNFSKCGIAEDDYNGQKAAIESITDFSIKYNVHTLVVAHNRKADSDRQAGGKLDVKGTGAITDLVDNVFVWWRNRVKEQKLQDPELSDYDRSQQLKKPDAFCICEKQRGGDYEPRISLWFDRQSHQFLDDRTHIPRRYVEDDLLRVPDEEHEDVSS